MEPICDVRNCSDNSPQLWIESEAERLTHRCSESAVISFLLWFCWCFVIINGHGRKPNRKDVWWQSTNKICLFVQLGNFLFMPLDLAAAANTWWLPKSNIGEVQGVGVGGVNGDMEKAVAFKDTQCFVPLSHFLQNHCKCILNSTHQDVVPLLITPQYKCQCKTAEMSYPSQSM